MKQHLKLLLVSQSLLFICTSCAGHQQSAIDPAGPQSGRVATLWWFFFWLLGVIFILVLLVMLRTLMPGHRTAEETEPLENHQRSEARETRLRSIVTMAGVLTVV